MKDLEADILGRDCKTCGIHITVEELYKLPDSRYSSGYNISPYCKACRSAKTSRYNKAHPKAAASAKQRWWRKHLYGLTAIEYETLVLTHKGCCLLCGKKPDSIKGLHIDHDHKTGKVRGLLCFNCNTALGKFNDDHKLLSRAASYVRGEIALP